MKASIYSISYEKNNIDGRCKSVTSDVTDGLVDLIEKLDDEIDELDVMSDEKDELYEDEELVEFLSEKKRKLRQIMNILSKTLNDVLKEE